jgi:hypothetical protein
MSHADAVGLVFSGRYASSDSVKARIRGIPRKTLVA